MSAGEERPHLECRVNVGDVVGTIEPGKRADLVVVDGDPLDVRGLRGRIEAVYQDGVLVA